MAVVDHLTSFNVVNVSAEEFFKKLVSFSDEREILIENLISVLMDSYNAMRGSKSGLDYNQKKEKAPHLLDINRDSCHHIRNASKVFCKPFCGGVENYLTDCYLILIGIQT